MRVFVSWSGNASKSVALLMRDWIPRVVQEVEVYVSSQDIEKGVRWAAHLGDTLSEVDFGLIALTKENLEAPWILFEAGALSKSVKAQVIPILCNLGTLDIAGSPLSQFQQATSVTDAELWQVIQSINRKCEKPLSEDRLRTAFDKWWPDFRDAFGKIDFMEPEKPAKGKGHDAERLDRIENALGAVFKSITGIRRDLIHPITIANSQYNVPNLLAQLYGFAGADSSPTPIAPILSKATVGGMVGPAVLDEATGRLRPAQALDPDKE